MLRSGFTLIELLIVVAIIGILAAIAVPNFLNAQLKAKMARAQSETKSVGDSYVMYFMDQNGWPGHLDGQPAQHKFVTTPIAYLSSSVIDIFASQPGQPKFFSTFWGQYHAEPSLTHHRRITEEPIFDQTWDVAFFVTSLGPTDEHQPMIIYDSSNGLISLGDILHFTFGDNNAQYPFATRPRR